MAEGGIVGRIFGGSEGEEAEADVLAGGADPIAAAVAMDAARFDPELSREAAAYLRKQAHLVDLQAEHLHEQRAVQLDHLKLRRVGERMRVAIQSFFVAVGVVIACGFIWMVWDAATDHGLVVEAFSVPPALAQRGLTGQVVSKLVLNDLAKLQEETDSSRAPGTYTNNWGEDLKVEIPETGVSISDLQRFLRNALGHETHIAGEIYQGAETLSVTAHAGEAAAQTVSGHETELSNMLQLVAEDLYRRTQPYRYAGYLRTHGRVAEARTIYNQLASSSDPTERAWAHSGLGYLAGQNDDGAEYVAQERLALDNKPGFALALLDIAASGIAMDHEAEAVRFCKAALDSRNSLYHDIAADYRVSFIAWCKSSIDQLAGREQSVLRDVSPELTAPSSTLRGEAQDIVTDALFLEHDPAFVREASKQGDPINNTLVLGFFAAAENLPSAVLELRAGVDPMIAKYGRSNHGVNRVIEPMLALAEAESGDVAGAGAMIVATPLDCDVCLRMRGTVASFAKDRDDSEKWFAQAISATPALPWAYLSRGQARFREGDLEGALTDAQKTVRIAPQLADGYGLWGDVLARRGQWGAAKAKYEEALRYAPAWAAARRAHDQVASRA